jgi:hypothetical protein
MLAGSASLSAEVSTGREITVALPRWPSRSVVMIGKKTGLPFFKLNTNSSVASNRCAPDGAWVHGACDSADHNRSLSFSLSACPCFGMQNASIPAVYREAVGRRGSPAVGGANVIACYS